MKEILKLTQWSTSFNDFSYFMYKSLSVKEELSKLNINIYVACYFFVFEVCKHAH